VQLVDRPLFSVVGIEVVAPWDELFQAVPAAFKQLVERLEEIPHRSTGSLVDVSVEVRDGVYRELIGTPVDRIDAAPAGMIGLTFAAQRFVHHRHAGPVDAIAAAYQEIYDWGRAQGLALDDLHVRVSA
jgi:predicted transcriptional regulator YdeE